MNRHLEGRKRLRTEMEEWNRLSAVMASILALSSIAEIPVAIQMTGA